MKLQFLACAAIALSLFAPSCIADSNSVTASGPDVTGEIQIGNFDAIDASRAFTVNYTIGDKPSLSYIVPQSLVEHLDIRTVNGVLQCTLKDVSSLQLRGRKAIINVTGPVVNSFEAESAATINVNSPLTVTKLNIEASSSGTVNIPSVEATTADIEANSSATVNIADIRATKLDAEASSSGTIAFSGEVSHIEAEASSASNLTINCQCSDIKAEASSAAKIIIKGSCATLAAEATSASTIDATAAKIGTGTLKASSASTIRAPKPQSTPYTTKKSSGATIKIK